MLFQLSEKVVLCGYLKWFGFYQLCMSVKSQNSFIDMFRNDSAFTDIHVEGN